MDFIDIDNAKETYSNDEVFTTIKYILKNEKDPLEKHLIISYLIKYITNETLFKKTIELLENTPILKNTFEQLINTDSFIERQSIKDPESKARLKAIIFSVSLYYRLLLEKFKTFIQKSDLPELKFNVNNKILEYNLTEITDLIKRKSIGFVRDEIISIPNIKNQEIEIKKMIQSMEVIDYDNNTNSFQNEIKHFESIKNNLVPKLEIKSNIKHDHIFSNNGFILFEYILNEYVKTKRGRLSDIHFFYWSMYNDTNKFIHQRPERFKEWFLENYTEDLGKIKTYNEVENPDRNKHYSNALDWFKTQN